MSDLYCSIKYTYTDKDGIHCIINYHKSKRMLEGYYSSIKNKVKMGIWTEYRNNIVFMKSFYNNPKFYHIDKRYYPNGNIRIKEYFKLSPYTLASYKIKYNIDGTRKSEGSMYDGCIDSAWTMY